MAYPARSWLKGLVPLLLFGALVLFLANGLTRDPSKLPSELIDRPVPEFALTTLDGESVTQAALSGDVSLLNVFGSWCVACLQEHPLFMALSEAQSVRLVGINWRDRPENARRWLARYGDPYSLIIADPESRLVIDLGVTGAPETFVIDKTGRIRYKHTGVVTETDWTQTLQPLISALRDESPSEGDDPAL